MKHSRSDPGSGRIRYRVLTGIALLVAVAPLVASVAPSVVTTDLFIVSEDEPIAEDVYVAATSGRVEGRIEGDLVITAGSLSISGTVAGDVIALTSGTVRVEPGGVVEGSLRTVTPQVVIDGDIRNDVFVTGLGVEIGPTGTVGRDVILFGGTLTIDGAVGRDVRGRLLNTLVVGTVGRDIDLSVQRLTVDSGASVAGDVLYRSPTEASIAPGTVDGQVVQLPAQSNFIFGVILAIANVLGLLAFIVSGIILIWLFRGTGAAAVEAIERHPIKTVLIGVLALVAAPILVLLLAVTLVGLPLAAVLLAAMLLGLVFGPVPAVAAGGDLLLRRKGGLFGGFVIGAVLWRLGIWLIPIVGVLLYLAGLIWGVGGWVLGAWRIRAARPVDREALPPALTVKDDDIPDGWEYPLPPSREEAPPEANDQRLVPPTAGRGKAEERSDDAEGHPQSDPSPSEGGGLSEARGRGGRSPSASDRPSPDSPSASDSPESGEPSERPTEGGGLSPSSSEPAAVDSEPVSDTPNLDGNRPTDDWGLPTR